jgi:hypothetical protein
VQESLIPFWTNWVMAWGKYLSPRKCVDAGAADVEAFLQHLVDKGKAGWQLKQAEAALKLLHQSRYPAPWSVDWLLQLIPGKVGPPDRPGTFHHDRLCWSQPRLGETAHRQRPSATY